jgi:hypothetical protein
LIDEWIKMFWPNCLLKKKRIFFSNEYWLAIFFCSICDCFGIPCHVVLINKSNLMLNLGVKCSYLILCIFIFIAFSWQTDWIFWQMGIDYQKNLNSKIRRIVINNFYTVLYSEHWRLWWIVRVGYNNIKIYLELWNPK